jgi:hypothetical protein
MRKNKLLLVASAGLMLVLAGNVVGKPRDCGPDCVSYKMKPVKVKPVKVKPVSAPEIDVGSGGSAIALVVTAMLLAAERSRRT